MLFSVVEGFNVSSVAEEVKRFKTHTATSKINLEFLILEKRIFSPGVEHEAYAN